MPGILWEILNTKLKNFFSFVTFYSFLLFIFKIIIMDDDESTVVQWRNKMKLFYDETMEAFDKKPCDGSRTELKACLIASDCHQIHKRSLKECLKSRDGTVPDDCLARRVSFYECKRSLLDNRQRFRGRKGY